MAWAFEELKESKMCIILQLLNWVKQAGKLLPDFYEPGRTPQVGELDELQTFVGSKKQDLDSDSSRPL